jgi:multidrug efflux system outer membrane protein
MKRLLIGLLAALLAACAIGPAYKRPPTNPPSAFRGESGAPSAKSLADLAWWELYRDPVLEKLIGIALKQNYDVRIAIARVEEFRSFVGISNLGSIPQISAGGYATRSRVSTVGPTPLPSSAAPVRATYNAEIDVAYEVDLWKRIASLSAAARADFVASEFARDATQVSVISNVATSYFALRSLDEQLLVTQRTVAAREKFLELTRAQFKRGVVSGLDVSRAEASLATARAALPDLVSQIAQTENQLQILLGENPAPIVREAAQGMDFFPTPPEVPTGLPSALLERRPDLRQAENALIGANARLRATKAALFPTISLTGMLGSQSAALSNLFTGPAATWSFGLSLLQPIIDANRNIYQVQAFTAREKQAMLQYQQAVAQAFREVADALAARQGFSESLRAQDEQVAALRDANRLVLKRYAVGYSSYFEVIDADTSLFNAELLRLQAYRNTLNSLVSLYKALGGGWQPAAGGEPAPLAAAPEPAR